MFLTLSATAYADGSRAGAFTVAPMVGGYRFEGNEDFDLNGFAAGLGLGYNLTDFLAVEGMFNYVDTEYEIKPRGKVGCYLYRVDLLYNIIETNGFEPYLAAGAGGITTDIDRAGTSTDFMVEYGGGLRYFATDDLAIRADIRHVLPFDEHRNNLLYTFGIQYQFGGRSAPEAKPEPAPAPPPPDTDGDGVIDRLDKCPGTPKGVKVDKDGCPLDTDGDGVYDYKDECPDTPKGTKVDAKGCPPPLCITLNVQFDFDKADIKPEFHNEIKAAADFLKKNAAGKDAVLEGHTDDRGEADYNQKLSQARAEAVMNYMVENFGIDANKISAKGYGESQPIADNSSEEGRFKNRRVVLRICE